MTSPQCRLPATIPTTSTSQTQSGPRHASRLAQTRGHYRSPDHGPRNGPLLSGSNQLSNNSRVSQAPCFSTRARPLSPTTRLCASAPWWSPVAHQGSMAHRGPCGTHYSNSAPGRPCAPRRKSFRQLLPPMRQEHARRIDTPPTRITNPTGTQRGSTHHGLDYNAHDYIRPPLLVHPAS